MKKNQLMKVGYIHTNKCVKKSNRLNISSFGLFGTPH